MNDDRIIPPEHFAAAARLLELTADRDATAERLRQLSEASERARAASEQAREDLRQLGARLEAADRATAASFEEARQEHAQKLAELTAQQAREHAAKEHDISRREQTLNGALRALQAEKTRVAALERDCEAKAVYLTNRAQELTSATAPRQRGLE